MRWLVRGIAIAGILLGVAACATVAPRQELVDAKSSLEAARNVGGDVYSPNRFRRASEGIQEAEREFAQGHSVIGRALANEARENAEAAEAETLVIKARAQQAATQAIGEVRERLQAAHRALADLHRRGAAATDLNFPAELESQARSSLGRAQDANDRGDSQQALVEVAQARQTLGRIEGDLPKLEAALQAQKQRLREQQEEQQKKQDLERQQQARGEAAAPPPATPEPVVKPKGLPTPPPPSVSPAPPETYTVKAGDSLWRIAARADIYHNPWLWPLIFKANAKVLEKPDRLRVGQRLIIPRNYGKKEAQEAEHQARQRGNRSLTGNR